MKKMKRFSAVLAATLMAATISIPMSASVGAWADATDAGVITLTQDSNDTASHTYSAYKIFGGTVSEGQLQNIVWANATNGPSILTKLQSSNDTALQDNNSNVFSSCTTAADVASVLSGKENDSDFMKAVASIIGDTVTASSSGFTASATGEGTGDVKINLSDGGDGYYLIADTTSDTMTQGAKSRYILTQVDASATDIAAISVKSALPTVDKQVLDETTEGTAVTYDDNGNVSAGGSWVESADHAIGEKFQFKLTANLTADDEYASYEKYAVTFTDTMSAGVAYESIQSVTVKGKDSSGNDVSITVSESDYTTTASTDTNNGGTSSTSWTLSIADLKSLKDSDSNTIDLTKGATVEVIYDAHLTNNAITIADNGDGKTYNANLGDSVTDPINANKVSLTYSNNPNGEGTGTTTEDTVYVAAYEFTVTKTIDSAAGAKAADARFKLNTSADKTDSTYVKIDETTGEVTLVGASEATEFTPAANDSTNPTKYSFTISGLDAGTYYLEETTTPSGYNTAGDSEIVIDAAHYETGNESGDDKNGTDGSALYSVDIKSGNDSDGDFTIDNQSGSTLPSTGGIGTTIFYLVGGTLVIGASILLITKKRAKDEQ